MKEIMTNAESRKNVVKALAEHLGEKAVYAGPPTFAYQVGNITVDREGKIILEDESRMEEITAVLTECGFLGNSKEDTGMQLGGLCPWFLFVCFVLFCFVCFVFVFVF